LKTTPGYHVEKTAGGMYYVHGRDFPIQIVETKRLSERENLWLASLRDDLTVQSAERVLAESGKRREPGIAAYLYALTTARSKVFTEVWNMTKRQKEFEQFLTQVAEESGQLEKWRQEGIVQGVHQTKLETARNLRNMGCDNEFIVAATGLAPADIAAL
jgi:predicted transposase YdaD